MSDPSFRYFTSKPPVTFALTAKLFARLEYPNVCTDSSTVTVVFSISAQIAVTVMFFEILITSPGAYSVPSILHALKIFLSGAANAHSGSSYSPDTPPMLAIVPLPPAESNETL